LIEVKNTVTVLCIRVVIVFKTKTKSIKKKKEEIKRTLTEVKSNL